jgi:hypothetical protein
LRNAFLPPAQEGVAFAVARELELGIQLECVGFTEIIDLDRVIDDEFDRLQRIDFVGIAAETNDAVPHRRQIDDGRNSGEILQQHAGGRERYFLLSCSVQVPSRERLDVAGFDKSAVLVAQQVLEQNLHRVRQPCDFRKTGFLECGKAVGLVGTPANRKRGSRAEAVHGRHLLLREGIAPRQKVNRTTDTAKAPRLATA